MQTHLRRLGLFSAPLLLALTPWLPGASSSVQDDGPELTTRQKRIVQASEQFEGAWQLTSARFAGKRLSGKSASGYLLVTPGHMALELHLLFDSSNPRDDPNPSFQSSTSRWRMLSADRLQTSTLIGNTNITRDEQWRFAQPGSPKEMMIMVSESQLILDQKNKSRLEFRRLAELPFPGGQRR